jgi:L-fuconolactonase
MTAPTPRIDAHQHFWRYDPAEFGWIDDSMASLRRDFMPPDLEPLLRATGFDGCVAVQARQSLEETTFLLGLAEVHPFVVGVVGWVDLQSKDVREQLASLAHRKRLVGVRHIVQGEPDDRFLLRPEFCRGISALAEFGLGYDILIYPRHLPAAAELAARFPAQRFVLDHLAKPEIRAGEIEAWKRDLHRLASCPNVLCKLSGLVTEADWRGWTAEGMRRYLDVAFEAFGAERLMIGSDWPVCTVAASYGRTMGLVSDYMKDRPAGVQAAVLGGNAQRFWNLPEEERAR